MHKLFYTEGEYRFGELDLFGYGWNRIYPLEDENKIVASIVIKDGKPQNEIITSEDDGKKTLIYENKKEQVMAVIHLDCKNNYHEIDISANKNPEENLEIIRKAKSTLERELKCTLEDREKLPSKLINKIESN